MDRYFLQNKTVNFVLRNLCLFTQSTIFKPFKTATYIISDAMKMFQAVTDNALGLTFLG